MHALLRTNTSLGGIAMKHEACKDSPHLDADVTLSLNEAYANSALRSKRSSSSGVKLLVSPVNSAYLQFSKNDLS